jgi:cyclopropane-fatty-acyl-phospholipid synthase
MPFARTGPLRRRLARTLPSRPFAVRFWDGTLLPASDGDGAVFTVRSPAAVACALRAPGQLGIGRAYVAGLLEVDDLDAALDLLTDWEPPPLDRAIRARLALAAACACGLTLPPPVPEVELRPRGRRHSPARDARAVRHHYDVSNEFFALFLDPSMTYSCGVFSRGASTLEEAQRAKLELVCDKLALEPGDRVLDVGCGWGSFAIHAAATRGAEVVGITLSEPQARFARDRAAREGVADRVEIRVIDYRQLIGERFDAIASVGMVEHVGSAQIDRYAQQLASLLEPGGRLLNHGIARLRHSDPEAGPFSERYVFPDAAPLHLSRVLSALERAGFATERVEGFAADYAETLTHWLARLEDQLEDAVRLAGEQRVRVWRIYLRAARRGFRTGFTSIYQIRAHLPERLRLPASRVYLQS